MLESKLPNVEKIMQETEIAWKDAARLNNEPGDPVTWPAAAVAEAEELAEALAEAARRARRLYALTPSSFDVRELEHHEGRR